MTHTALKEQYGGSVDVTLSTTTPYQCSHDSRHGCRRFYIIRPTVVGAIARLPNADYQTIGANPSITIINRGTQDLTVQTASGTLVGVLPANIGAEFYCLYNIEALNLLGTPTWTFLPMVNTTVGASLNTNRIPFSITYTASSASAQTIVRNDIARTYGYVASDGPAAVTVTIKSNVVIGGGTTTTASFDTGSWPAGTTMMVMLESGSRIAGCGGTGGFGATSTGNAPTSGQNGGPAMRVRCTTAIVNSGVIAGGGGGGGGGARVFVGGVWIPGGSGGGGAGVPAGAGGARVSSFVGTEGSAGNVIQGGAPGQALPNGYSGGFGGFQGDAGAAGIPLGLGAPASLAGPAIQVSTGVTLTNILTGTQLGGTVTV